MGGTPFIGLNPDPAFLRWGIAMSRGLIAAGCLMLGGAAAVDDAGASLLALGVLGVVVGVLGLAAERTVERRRSVRPIRRRRSGR